MYNQINSEIRYILTSTGIYSAEYIEKMPVQFRKSLVTELIKAQQEKADGGQAVNRS